MISQPAISIIIPVLNDAPSLDACLSQFTPLTENMEILVVDGGSRDDTYSRIALLDVPVKLIASEPGRGRQLHTGAQSATGSILLFFHADTRLPSTWQEDILSTLQKHPDRVGYFDLHLDREGRFFRSIELGVRLRSNWLKLPYGDQAYFMAASTYSTLGGFNALPLMEDVDFIERASKEVGICSTSTPVITSARNWTQDGKWKRAWKNLNTIWKYKRGTRIEDLQTAYAGIRPAISIFCKKPEPGKVKTRLAASIGRTQAAELYRQMAENTLIEMSRVESVTLYVSFTPAENYEYFYHWLGPASGYLAQPEGDLGHRLLTTARTLKTIGHTHILLIGTDCPDLKRNHVLQSLDALKKHDVVIIPSFDGGYTLIGMKEVCAELFQDIDWSTERVLEQTLNKAEQNRLTVSLLDPLKDIDTADDLRRGSTRDVPAPPSDGRPAGQP